MSNFVIRDQKTLTDKAELVEALIGIQQAVSGNVKKEETKEETQPNPHDLTFHGLKCEIQPLDEKNSEYQMLSQYVKNTQQYNNL